MRPLVVWHRSDLDGVCSAAIVKHFVPDCELHGIDYGDTFPWDKVRPGIDAENDPLWADCFKPENGYVAGESWEQLRFTKRAVYLVDFSLKPEDMKRLAEVSDLVWIDHHRTALKAWFEDPERPVAKVVGDIRFAACELTWMYFAAGPDINEKLNGDIQGAEGVVDPNTYAYPDEWARLYNTPEAVRLLGAYDSWRKDDPDWETKILPFQYGCRSLPGIYDPTCYMWQNLCWNPAGACVEVEHMIDTLNNGRAILSYQAEVNRKACEAGAHEFELQIPRPDIVAKFNECIAEAAKDPVRVALENPGPHSLVLPTSRGIRVLACNTIVFNSQFFEGFYNPEYHDVMVAYCQVHEKSKVYRGTVGGQMKWKVSIYSTKPEIDCGAIAKAFGGGGHKGAAGFECDRLPWEVYA